MQTERVNIAESAWIASTARVGEPFRPGREWDRLDRVTAVGERCEVAHFCLVGEESTLGDDSTLDAYCWIEDGATVGDRSALSHRASVGANAVIGDDCVISGATVAARGRVGRGCQVYGDLVHRRLDPSVPASQDAAPVLADHVFVGWGAKVVGGVAVGRGSYICAGATVTKEIPAGVIVTGINEIHDPATWHGALAKSDFFDAAQPAEAVEPRRPEQATEPSHRAQIAAELRAAQPSQGAHESQVVPAPESVRKTIELPKTPASAARARERSRLEE